MKKNTINSDTLLSLISKHSPDMLWIKDLNGRYLYANNAICNGLLIATPNEVIGKTDIFLTSSLGHPKLFDISF